MRVVFRVDGEPQIGLGHVMRCLALAQSLVKNGHTVFFFMSPDSQKYFANKVDWPAPILPIPLSHKIQEPAWLSTQCSNLDADWLVLDGYQFDQAYRRLLQLEGVKLAVFDDMNNSGQLCVDMVINGARHAKSNGYQVTAPEALLALGEDYLVLRQEFLQQNKQNWSQRAGLTLTFGGSDPKKLTLLILQSLQKAKTSIPITVVTGGAYTGLHELDEWIKRSQLEITHLHDCQDMAKILVNSQLVISAAGGSQFELLSCATPAILVVVANNQIKASQDAASQGWCQVVSFDALKDKSFADQLVARSLSLFQQPALLCAMHKRALQFKVIDGAKNIVELMSGQNRDE